MTAEELGPIKVNAASSLARCKNCAELAETFTRCPCKQGEDEVYVNKIDDPKYSRPPVDHYIRGGIECIDVMRAISTPQEFAAYCRLTAIKYLYRMGEKDDPAKEARKAEDYIRWMRETLEGIKPED